MRVSFRYDASARLDDWERVFTYVSHALAHATNGGLRIGRIEYVNNDLSSGTLADIWVLSGNAGHTGAVDGLPGIGGDEDAHITIGTNVLWDGAGTEHQGTVLHELGHYALGLWDEYQLAGVPATCIATTAFQSTGGACIMQSANRSIEMSATEEKWFGAADPPPRVTEFCIKDHVGSTGVDGTDLSHQVGGGTDQHARNSEESCWETILRKVDGSLQPPDGSIGPPAVGGAIGAAPKMVWEERDALSRFALVLDRSGSMADAGAIEGVRYAAHTWIDLERLLGNELSIVSYADQSKVEVSTREMTKPEAEDAHDLVDLLDADGRTNITTALQFGDDQLELVIPGSNPASRHIILFSDGVHNEGPPLPGPGIATAGTIVHTLGFGNADRATLERIKTTPGYIHVSDTFDPLNNELAINNAISEVAAESHSSMLERARIELPPVERLADEDRLGTPEDLEEIAGLDPAEVDARGDISDLTVLVDEGVTHVTFVANHRSVDSVFLYVLDPDGLPVTPTAGNFASRGGHATYSFAPTRPGRWTMRIRRLANQRSDPAPVVLFAFAEHPTLTTTVIGRNRLYRVDETVELHAYAQNPFVLENLEVNIWPEDDPSNVQPFTQRSPGHYHFPLPDVDQPTSTGWVVEFVGNDDTIEVLDVLDDPELREPQLSGPFRRIKRFQIHHGPLSPGEDTDPAPNDRRVPKDAGYPAAVRRRLGAIIRLRGRIVRDSLRQLRTKATDQFPIRWRS